MTKTRSATHENNEDINERAASLSLEQDDEEMADATSHDISTTKPTSTASADVTKPDNTSKYSNIQDVGNDNNSHLYPIDTEQNINNNVNVDNEMLKNKYQEKINALHLRIIDIEDAKEIQNLQNVIAQLQKTLDSLNGKETSQPTTIEKKKEKRKIPSSELIIFQLTDDPPETKVDNKVSYDNAESFIAAFETIIKINDLEIDDAWRSYIPECFLFSKNKNNSRWYLNSIDPLLGDKSLKWNDIKEKIIWRFGDCATNTNRFKKYINLKQERNETIKEYIDRYLESYKRLPISEPSNMIQVAHFIDSLLPRTREEVENCLKRHKQGDKTLYPQDLNELFEFLIKNIGDIQEALFINFTSGSRQRRDDADSKNTATKHDNHYKRENDQAKSDNAPKRSRNNDNYTSTNTSNSKPNSSQSDRHYSSRYDNRNSHYDNRNRTSHDNRNNSSYDNRNSSSYDTRNTTSSRYDNRNNNDQYKNQCGYCKKAEYSFEHLKECIPYLNSDKYKQRIKEEKVHILFTEYKDDQTSDINVNSETEQLYEQLNQDLEDVFEDIKVLLSYDDNKFLNFYTINNEHELSQSNITCFAINELTEKDFQEMSPYSPLITINNERLIGFLDTGAQVSLINKSYDFEDRSIFENFIPTSGTFSYVDKNASTPRTGKTHPLEVKYRGRPSFEHHFEIIEMSQTNIPVILGRDIIPKLGIYITNIAYTFEDQEEFVYEDTVDYEMFVPNVTKACSEEEYIIFMEKMEPYLEANKNINIHDLCPLKEAVVYIETPPNAVVKIRQYPIAYALQPVVREQIQKWLEDGTIEPAQPSGFNNPLTMTPKPDDSEGNKRWRVCMDTRAINLLIGNVSNVNTPLIEDIFHSVRDAKVFSVFDISGAFHRLKINKSDRHKLTFTFDNKSWQFRGACFGLKSLSGIFQNVMEIIFADMKEFTCSYIDDLVCFSKDMASHEEHCRRVIEALTKHNLPINIEKTHLARNSVYLLGFCISEQGKSIDPRRVTNIDEWQKPQTPKAMMKFCGWVSYMRNHLPYASELTGPLDSLRYSTQKTLTWTPQMHEHYDSIINIIKQNIVLSHPDLNHPFSLSVDASQYAIGACLFQEYENEETGTKTIKYIGFFSKAFSQSQRRYSVTQKELYALTMGLKRFYKFLHGSTPFKCYTDHRSLSYLFTTKHMSMMMLRYMEIILSFPNMQIIWIPGKDNVMSDKLSRLFPQSSDRIAIEKEDKQLFPHIFPQHKHKQKMKFKTRRSRKQELKKMVKQHFANHDDKFIDNDENTSTIERLPDFSIYHVLLNNDNPANEYISLAFMKDEDTSDHTAIMKTWGLKTIHDLIDEHLVQDITDNLEINYVQKMDESYIVPPEDDRPHILKIAHEFGHYGGEAIVQRIRKEDGMNWPNIIKDALEIASQCAACQKFVISKRGYNPLKPLYCYSPGWHYQMDLCGPFPCTSSNNTYILVLLDVATRFLVLRPLPDKSAKTVAKILIDIFSLVGYPRILNTDRGTEWKNQILDTICEAMKIDKRLSTAYYSQGNGGAERAVQNTKKLLSKLILGISEDNWDIALNSVQLMINCKISKRLLTSPFNLMFARRMTNEYPLFADPDDQIEPMDTDTLLKRIEYMSDIVFPAIKERTEIYNKMMKDQFDKKHRLVDFPVGSYVVVRKKGIQKSLAPVYEGPYEVVRKTDNNNYTLRDELGLLMPREYTPSELKLVSQDSVVSKEDIYEFDGIVDHRGDPGKREYKIRWKNYSPEHDTWITADMFTDPQSIVHYWKRIKGAVHKKDADQLKHALEKSDNSDLPKFHKHKKGKLLDSIEPIAEAIADSSTTASKSNTKSTRKTQRFTKTSTHTKPVNTSPGHKQFRRSQRNRHSFQPAMDTTKYKK